MDTRLALPLTMLTAALFASAATWTPLNTGLPIATPGISVLAIDADGSAFYAVTNSGALARSTDGAASWEPVGGISGISSLTIDPTNSSTLFAVTGRGVLRSTDPGQTWKNVGQNLAGFGLMVAIDPVTPATVYALTFGHIYKSLDGGDNWGEIYNFASPQSAGTIAIDPRTPSTLYVSVTNADILKSTDGGLTWAAIRTGLPPTIFATGAIPLVIDPQTPSNCVCRLFCWLLCIRYTASHEPRNWQHRQEQAVQIRRCGGLCSWQFPS